MPVTRLVGRLDLSWSSNRLDPENGHVTLRIQDEASGAMIAEVEVPLNEFALALSSAANRPCTVRLFPNAAPIYGARHENTEVTVPGLNHDTWADRYEIIAKWITENLPGWETADVQLNAGQDESSPNGHRLVHGTKVPDGYRVILHRFLDPETGAVVR